MTVRPQGPDRRGLLVAAGASAALAATQAWAQRPSPNAKPLEPQVTAPLSRFIAGSATAAFPEEIRDLARRHILDTLASVVACRDLEPSVLGRKFALSQSGGATKNAATILGVHDKASLIDAVFASAMTAHGSEINDFIPSAFVQPGPSIVSASIALAEVRGLSGDAVVRAVITGYELAGRMPKALGINNLRGNNIANHGIGPVFGTGAAAASLLKLTEVQVPEVLTFCSQQASGSYQWLLDTRHVEKSVVFGGMGARTGLQAALWTELGFTGVRNNLDHPAGYMGSAIFRGGDASRAYLIDQLGSRWELPLTAYKRYSVGGPTQPTVHGMLQLLPQIRRSEVASVRIEMPGDVTPFHSAEMPALNIPYLVAIILLDGRFDLVAAQSLERMASDKQAAALAAKVEVVRDASQEAKPGEPRPESARVTVTHRDGRKAEIFVPYVPGYPSHPLTKAQVEEKALELMSRPLGDRRAKAVVAQCWDLDNLKHAGALAGLVAR